MEIARTTEKNESEGKFSFWSEVEMNKRQEKLTSEEELLAFK